MFQIIHYVVIEPGRIALTLSAVRLRLAEEEARELQDHTDVSLHTDISPFILISQGIDIEEMQ